MSLDHPLNSLGFAKPPAETRVVVAMSGGVDSSAVAAQLASEGYDVVGVTLQLYDHGAALAKKGACCAGRDIHDARRVAQDATPRKFGVLGNHWCQNSLIPMKDKADAWILVSRKHKTRDNSRRSTVSAHGIDRNHDSLRGLPLRALFGRNRCVVANRHASGQ